MTLQLRHQTPDDIAAIEAVTIAAFADAPHTSHTEQFIVRALRAANELTLSIVAEEYGRVVDHVALSPVTITHEHGRKTEGWYGLRPISVLPPRQRSEEHTSELQSLMRISYAVFCLKKKKTIPTNISQSITNISPTHAT